MNELLKMLLQGGMPQGIPGEGQGGGQNSLQSLLMPQGMPGMPFGGMPGGGPLMGGPLMQMLMKRH